MEIDDIENVVDLIEFTIRRLEDVDNFKENELISVILNKQIVGTSGFRPVPRPKIQPQGLRTYT